MIKLFLAEDEIAMREGIKRLIHWEEEGIDFCGEAGDGELAWPQILEQRPDIVITDIKMPFMDGLELSRLIRKELPDTKIVILSGYGEFEYAQEALRIGVAEYLLKPITPKRLREVIGALADSIKEERKNKEEQFDLMLEEKREKDEHDRRRLLRTLISAESGTTQILSLADEIGLKLSALAYRILLVYISGEADYRIIAVEPASCPSFTRGRYAYDFCDTGRVCPMAKMYTLGHDFIPSANHAGGLRYHGMSSVLSQLYADGYMEAVSVEQTAVFEAAEKFARVEGILPAPESSHAIRVAIDEALKCRETGEEKTIIFGLTGTGYFDLKAYEAYNDGTMTDYIPTDEDLAKGFASIPDLGL